MLEKLPRVVGSALSGIRSGLEKIASFSDLNDLSETIRLASQAFGNGEAIPIRYTADGMGISPASPMGCRYRRKQGRLSSWGRMPMPQVRNHWSMASSSVFLLRTEGLVRAR